MNVRRIRVAVLKIIVCTVVGVMAGMIFAACYDLYVDNWADVPPVIGFWIGAVFGLFVGISWAIKRKEVRTVFVVPSLVGLLISATGVLIRVSQDFEDDEAWHHDDVDVTGGIVHWDCVGVVTRWGV